VDQKGLDLLHVAIPWLLRETDAQLVLLGSGQANWQDALRGYAAALALRYGSVPIVRATGGIADTVIEGFAGNGFRMRDVVDPEIRPWRLAATMFPMFANVALLIRDDPNRTARRQCIVKGGRSSVITRIYSACQVTAAAAPAPAPPC